MKPAESAKSFTLDEANQMLPRVSGILDRLSRKKESCTRRHDMILMQHLIESAEKNQENFGHGSKHLESEIQDMESEVIACEKDLQELQQIGCFLRSLDKGCVEFPSKKNGEKIYLCWKKGETSIQFYRTSQQPVHQRQPIV